MKKEGLFGILRISLGLIFLWAFFDKLLGLGFATAKENAWLAGVSPTAGFLEFATKGPLATIFKALAGNPIIDWLFMLGLLLIGLTLIIGITTKLAGYSASLMFFLMWLAVLPPEHHPLLDDHIIYIFILLILIKVKAGDYIGLGKKWTSLNIVKKYKFLE
jgi:thiosulfate dehydrogenase [quinone] large subunit